jgi:hypothetical protein
VLGEFPTADDESLIPLRLIEAAAERTLPAKGIKRIAADIARFGDNDTVIGLRIGPVLMKFHEFHGVDTMRAAGEIRRLAFEFHPKVIAVDSIGIGAGVVDRLVEQGTEGIDPVNVSNTAYNPERFHNRRAELFWGLRERFRVGDISLSNQPDQKLIEELASIKYCITSRGAIRMESKDQMKSRLGRSPDRADMLALLFDSSWDWMSDQPIQPRSPSAAQLLREEMANW